MFWSMPGSAIKLEIRVYFKEKVWYESQRPVTQEDGSVILELQVAGTEETEFWIMSWGSKAEVIEPESLREEIRIEVS